MLDLDRYRRLVHRYVRDAEGNEHKPPGSPEGGQFTSQGGSGEKTQAAETIEGHEPAKKLGIEKVAAILQEQALRHNGGVRLDPLRNPQHRQIVLSRAVSDIKWIKTTGRGMGLTTGDTFYTTDLETAVSDAHKILEPLGGIPTPADRATFKVLLGITSQGNKPVSNFVTAVEIYALMLQSKDRRFPVVQPDGTMWPAGMASGPSVMQNLKLFDYVRNDMLKGSNEEFAKWAAGMHTLTEMATIRMNSGAFASADPDTGKPYTLTKFRPGGILGNMKDNEEFLGGFLFGPKVGAFGINMGDDPESDAVTVDMWMKRWYARYIADMDNPSRFPNEKYDADDPEKKKKPAMKIPDNASDPEMVFIKDLIRDAAKSVGISYAEAQSNLWFLEQHLWRYAGHSTAKPQTYLDGAKNYDRLHATREKERAKRSGNAPPAKRTKGAVRKRGKKKDDPGADNVPPEDGPTPKPKTKRAVRSRQLAASRTGELARYGLLIARYSEWKEEDHPRDPDGKFTDKDLALSGPNRAWLDLNTDQLDRLKETVLATDTSAARDEYQQAAREHLDTVAEWITDLKGLRDAYMEYAHTKSAESLTRISQLANKLDPNHSHLHKVEKGEDYFYYLQDAIRTIYYATPIEKRKDHSDTVRRFLENLIRNNSQARPAFDQAIQGDNVTASKIYPLLDRAMRHAYAALYEQDGDTRHRALDRFDDDMQAILVYTERDGAAKPLPDDAEAKQRNKSIWSATPKPTATKAGVKAAQLCFDEFKSKAALDWETSGTVYAYEMDKVCKKTVMERLAARIMNIRFNEKVAEYGGGHQFGKTDEERAVSAFIDHWAGSSGDNNKWSLAIQKAAEEEFGLEQYDRYRDRKAWRDAESVYETYEKFYRSVLRAMYDETQAWFKKRGITEVTLFRGIEPSASSGKPAGYSKAKAYAPTQIKGSHKPLSSFAFEPRSALSFVNGGALTACTVPVEKILSTPATGFGCLRENEMVVLGEMLPVTYLRHPALHGEEYDKPPEQYEQDPDTGRISDTHMLDMMLKAIGYENYKAPEIQELESQLDEAMMKNAYTEPPGV